MQEGTWGVIWVKPSATISDVGVRTRAMCQTLSTCTERGVCLEVLQTANG